MIIRKGDKKTIRGWAMYDWANSVYSLVITSTIFPIYYNAVTSSETTDVVQFLGRDFSNTALYSYSLSFAFLLVALISPLLSGIADYGGYKKQFMKFFCYLGAISCMSLFFFVNEGTLWIGILGLILATVGYSGSIVFYNAYLPEIAEPKDHDRVSAKGYALGYIGSSLLLIFNLHMVITPEFYGISDDSFAPRFSFLMVGLWWIGFAQISFKVLPGNVFGRMPKGNVIFKGYRELRKVWAELGESPHLKRYLLFFFFISMGVQTVMYVAAIFGDKELKMEAGQLITTVLIIQFVAIGGAYFFSWLSSRIGNIAVLGILSFIWILVCIGAYNVSTVNGFYILAFVVGSVMGGIQSLSRSTYSKILPETIDHASYFSFYDVCEKVGIVLGTASYGLIEELTGSMRNSVVALTVFFIVGLIMLFRIPSRKFLSPEA